MAEKQKNYKAVLVKGASYSFGPGKHYFPGRPVVVGEKLAAEMKATGRFTLTEMAASKAAPKKEKGARKGAKGKGKK